jgi:hypothetical protein
VFDGERQRETDERRWVAERRHWLRLAGTVKAPLDRRQRLERAPLSAASVQNARTLYLASAEREVRAARRARKWSEVATIRREQAAALFREVGSPVPPPDDVVSLHREAAAAALRAIAPVARQAELVGGTCCAACRADDGKTFRIADELRAPRLPHPGCPRGLCGCDWWVATEAPKRRRRTSRSRAAAAGTATAATNGAVTAAAATAAAEADDRIGATAVDDPGPTDAPAAGDDTDRAGLADDPGGPAGPAT